MRKGPAIVIHGIDVLKDNLTHLLPSEAQRIMRQAVGQVAAEIRDEVRENLPPNVKHYRTSIAVYRPRLGRTGKYFVSADVVAKRTPPRPFYIANIVEYGTKDRYTKSGAFRGRVKAQPFKRPVIERWRPKVSARFNEVLQQKLREDWERRKVATEEWSSSFKPIGRS